MGKRRLIAYCGSFQIAHFANSDGMDLSGLTDSVVERSFVHNGDDAYIVKAWNNVSNVTVRDSISWADCATSFGASAEIFASVDNVHFVNCTAIHSLASGEWGGVLTLHIARGSGHINGTSFQNIVIEDAPVAACDLILIKIDSHPSSRIVDTTFVNIHALSTASPAVRLSPGNGTAAGAIERVSLDNVVVNGRPIAMADVINENPSKTSGITVGKTQSQDEAKPWKTFAPLKTPDEAADGFVDVVVANITAEVNTKYGERWFPVVVVMCGTAPSGGGCNMAGVPVVDSLDKLVNVETVFGNTTVRSCPATTTAPLSCAGAIESAMFGNWRAGCAAWTGRRCPHRHGNVRRDHTDGTAHRQIQQRSFSRPALLNVRACCLCVPKATDRLSTDAWTGDRMWALNFTADHVPYTASAALKR